MPTSASTHHLAYLDGWRGLAIGMVLAGHFALDPYLPGLSVLGVELFFVLSGRLMGEILFVRKSPLPRFFLRRCSRVYPALLVFVLLSTILWWHTPLGHGLLAVASALTFTLNYAMVLTHQVALLDHLWSLCVEEHAYTLLAAIAFATRRKAVLSIALMGGGALLAMANAAVSELYFGQDGFDIFWRTDVAVAPIFLSAALVAAMNRSPMRMPAWVAPCALLAAVIARSTLGMSALGFALTSTLLALAVNSLDFSLPAFRSALSWKPLTRIGLWSFSLYLWQQPFYKMSAGQGWPAVLALFAAAMLAGLLSFHLVEQPARTRLNAYFDKRIGARKLPAAEQTIGAR